jgi:hypothetical protein
MWPGDRGLLIGGGKARADSTHVLSAARELRWLEMVAEALRAALNALAQTAPEWLNQIAEPDWFRHYATRAEDSRFPKARSKREEIGRRIGIDGMRLLQAVASPMRRDQRAGSDVPRAWSRLATTRYPSLSGSKVVDCTVSPTLRNCATRPSYR